MTLSLQIVRRQLSGRMLFLVALLVLSSAPLFAQADGGEGGPPPGGGPPPDMMEGGGQQQRGPSIERQLKQLTKQLSLNADQQAKVKAILAEQRQKMGELMKGFRPPQPSENGQAQNSAQTQNGAQASGDDSQRPGPEQFEKMRAAMKALRDEANAAIAAQLSPEQLTKFNALLKQQRQRESQDGPPGPPPDGGGPDGGGPGGPGGGGPPMM